MIFIAIRSGGAQAPSAPQVLSHCSIKLICGIVIANDVSNLLRFTGAA